MTFHQVLYAFYGFAKTTLSIFLREWCGWVHRGPLSLASYEWRSCSDITWLSQLGVLFFFCPKSVPATPNLMAVSRRAWIVPLPSTFSNSAGGAYGHTAGNRRTWQTQKAGTGVSKILYRMYLLILFFEKTQVSKYPSLFHAEYNFCFTTTIFFVEVFFNHRFFQRQRPCRCCLPSPGDAERWLLHMSQFDEFGEPNRKPNGKSSRWLG